MVREAGGPRREDGSFSDIRNKLSCKRMERRLDFPRSPLCQPASIAELSKVLTFENLFSFFTA